jgi:hypothetical protein
MKNLSLLRKVAVLSLSSILMASACSADLLSLRNDEAATASISRWTKHYEANLRNLKQNCRLKYLQISAIGSAYPSDSSTTITTALPLGLLELTDERVRALVEELSGGAYKIEDKRVYRVAQIYYSQGKLKYVEELYSKEMPGGNLSMIANDKAHPPWRYDRGMHGKSECRILQKDADLENPLFCAVTPDMFLEDFVSVVSAKEASYVHVKYKDLMAIGSPETLKETDKTISYDTKGFYWDRDGRVVVRGERKEHVSFEIDKKSGLVLKNVWFDSYGNVSWGMFITKARSVDSIAIPTRMYNEITRIGSRNLFLVYDACVEPISDDEFRIDKIVPAGVPIVDSKGVPVKRQH